MHCLDFEKASWVVWISKKPVGFLLITVLEESSSGQYSIAHYTVFLETSVDSLTIAGGIGCCVWYCFHYRWEIEIWSFILNIYYNVCVHVQIHRLERSSIFFWIKKKMFCKVLFERCFDKNGWWRRLQISGAYSTLCGGSNHRYSLTVCVCLCLCLCGFFFTYAHTDTRVIYACVIH